MGLEQRWGADWKQQEGGREGSMPKHRPKREDG